MKKIKDMIVNSRVWRSFFRHGWPDNPLDRSLIMTTNVFFHLHPVKIHHKSLNWKYSLGLGLITTIVFGFLSLTGILLMFYYVPSVERAYSYITILQTEVPFGQLLRNLHRWSAHLMVIAAVLHMARVFYTGAYKPPREFNWVVGIILLLLTLAASFTGYLLPWDQLAFWAITVGTVAQLTLLICPPAHDLCIDQHTSMVGACRDTIYSYSPKFVFNPYTVIEKVNLRRKGRTGHIPYDIFPCILFISNTISHTCIHP